MIVGADPASLKGLVEAIDGVKVDRVSKTEKRFEHPVLIPWEAVNVMLDIIVTDVNRLRVKPFRLPNDIGKPKFVPIFREVVV